MTKKTPELIQQMFDALKNPSKRLTVWEEQFLESISDQYVQRGNLTDKQFETLEKIYAEMQEKQVFLQSFSSSLVRLSKSRQREKLEIELSKKLNEVK